MKAVIFASDVQGRLTPLTRNCPVPLLPILNTPFLEHIVAFLKGIGVTEIALVVGKEDAQISGYFGAGVDLGVQIRYVREERPEGTGGVLRRLKGYLQGEPFLVVSGSVFLSEADLSRDFSRDLRGAIERHLGKGASATVLMTLENHGPILEVVQGDRPGVFEQVFMIQPDGDRRKLLRFCGLSIFSPDLLDFIPAQEYFDIFEQLLPTLKSLGRSVQLLPIFTFNGGKKRLIETIEDYYRINHSMLLDLGSFTNGRPLDGSYHEVSEGVWIGKNVSIAPTANILGPVLVGDGCRIEDDAQIIGPAVLGPRTFVGRRALLRETITWDGATIEEESRSAYCIVGSSSTVKRGVDCSRTVVTSDPMSMADLNMAAGETGFPTDLKFLYSSFAALVRRLVFSKAKRAIDAAAALVGLLFCLPLFAVVALAIKIDSRGPVFFGSRRCGRGGREFKMLKFRTMVADAQNLQKEYIDKKGVDGPMFKLLDDPRVTRVGKILRVTSIDELPQLINVLRGDMSLVGPRPLASEEMKFHPTWRSIRLRVQPGITGLWQVNGRSRSNFSDWIQHDIDYVRNQSLILDLKILYKTFWAVIRMTGAY